MILLRCVLYVLFVAIVSASTSHSAPPIVRFAVIGDYGTGTSLEAQVALMVHHWQPEFIVTTGDNSYGSASIDRNVGQFYSDYIGNYSGAYGDGSPINRFFPSLGNHDYSDGAGVGAYLSYFTLPGNERYYDFVHGPVHIFCVNSNPEEPGGIAESSTQARWLQQRLAHSVAPWNVVYFHHPPYSSSSRHGSTPVMQWPFEAWGADVVMNGHDHTYERIMRDDNHDGDSLTYVVNGLGGRTPYTFATPVEGSAVRFNERNGAMLVTASSTRLVLDFYAVAPDTAGELIDRMVVWRDAGSYVCGDVTGDSLTNMADLTCLLDYYFYNLDCSQSLEAGDVNCNGAIDLADLVILAAHLNGTQQLACCSAGSPSPRISWKHALRHAVKQTAE